VHSVQTWAQRYDTNAGKTHSAKPDGFYDLVEQGFEGPYLEMFAFALLGRAALTYFTRYYIGTDQRVEQAAARAQAGLEVESLADPSHGSWTNPEAQRRSLTAAIEKRRQKAEAATTCARGHAWTPENTYWHRKSGKRQCRTCNRLRRQTGWRDVESATRETQPES
jgi:hypothetical protein